MRIKEIQLKNFKRFDDLTINLGSNPAKIVALVGPNGSGKSSVFDAFEQKLREYKQGKERQSWFYSKVLYALGLTDIEREAYNRSNAIRIVSLDGRTAFDKKSFYVRSPYRFTSHLDIKNIRELSPILEDAERPGSSVELDSRLKENYERLTGIFLTEYYRGERRGDEVRNEWIDKVNSILEKILDIRVSDLGNVIEGKGQLYFEKGKSKDFPYENLSAGEKEVIDLVLDLWIKVREFDDTVFAIDEPELHINTGIQRQLLIELEKLIPDSCQLWIATHSIGFLRALQEDLADTSQILDFSQADLFDGVATIEPMETARSNWQRIFRTALEDLTGLLAPRTIVYCEGRPDPALEGEEQGLDAIAYNKIFSSKQPDILFISSGGSTEPENNASVALAVLGKAFADVKLLLLKDMDINSDGSETTSEQRDGFLQSNPKVHRMLLRKELENYLFDHEIVSKRFRGVSEEDHRRVLGDVRKEDVKSKTGDLMRLCGINSGVNKQEFKLMLAEEIVPGTSVYEELERCILENDNG